MKSQAAPAIRLAAPLRKVGWTAELKAGTLLIQKIHLPDSGIRLQRKSARNRHQK
jgi:hypothetical protein